MRANEVMEDEQRIKENGGKTENSLIYLVKYEGNTNFIEKMFWLQYNYFVNN